MGGWLVGAAIVVIGYSWAVRVRVRVRKRINLSTMGGPSLLRPFSLVGLAIACATPAGASERRFPLSSGTSHDAPAPPWSGGGFPPPPQPLVRTRGTGLAPGVDSPRDVGTAPTAIHPLRRDHALPDPVPLFPRVRGERERRAGTAATSERARDRAACMAAHPAGKGSTPVERVMTRHVVEPGETLWSIAERHLSTTELARVARYWPRIHRANRKVIGPDPRELQIGLVLELPEEITVR